MATIDCQHSVNATCSPADLVNYCGKPVLLTTGQVVGLSFAAQAGFISATAVIILLSMVAYKYWENLGNSPGSEWRLIRTNIDAFMLNLLIADLLMSFGAILDVKWASERQTYCGRYCNAQGAIQILGETSVALFTLTITVYSFICVVRGQTIKYRRLLWGGVTVAVWLFVVLWAALGYTTHPKNGSGSFYAPTPYWCWISQKYKGERLAGEYVWLWIAGFGNILLYIPLFFILRGNIVWDEDRGWRSLRWEWLPSSSSRPSTEELFAPDDAQSILSRRNDGTNPKQLLWYPFAYTMIVLPMSIVRWITFKEKGNPSNSVSTATAVVVYIFNLSGLVNVILILTTRANVLLFGARGVIQNPEIPSEKQIQNGATEDGTGGAVSAKQSRRRWLRSSVNGPGVQTRRSSQASNIEDTGFGGPRVHLEREDDNNRIRGVDGIVPEHSSGRGPIPLRVSRDNSALRPNFSDFSENQLHPRNLATTALREPSEEYGPGRAYLESLGTRLAKNQSE